MNRLTKNLNFNNLAHNINEIKSIISCHTEIMAVIKADAYGHGLVEIASMLNKLNINSFGVATLAEAVKLRENNIVGEILIFSKTPIDYCDNLIKYDLTQTIVSLDYASLLNNLNRNFKVQVKINTGMNRLGLSHKKLSSILAVYKMRNINITGTYSHLSSSDNLDASSINFTKNQIDNFDKVINYLKSFDIDVKSTHLQASYGVLNYPNLKYDVVRIGIIMYGILSRSDLNIKTTLNLKPVLSLQARINEIYEVDSNEHISYGNSFISHQKLKVANVSIGYADGLPRALSNQKYCVLINKQQCEIIGNICMDQIIINITDKNVSINDEVEIFGEENSVEVIASKCQTITNDILARLSIRTN